MSVIKKTITDGISLNIIQTDKFKSNYISVNFINKMDKTTVAMNALLPNVLARGSKNYPNMASLETRLSELYATNISPRVYKRGDSQIFGFASYVLDNSYSIDNTDILDDALNMIGEILFNPLICDGIFNSAYVESEKRNLIDAINSKINNKNSYAVWRCQEEMCRGEAYGIPESGTAEDVEAITAKLLFDHYNKIIRSSKIEIYFVGNTDFDVLCGKLSEMFKPLGVISPPALSTEVIRSAGKVREITEDQPVTQGKLSLGFRTGTVLADGNYHIFSLFAELFGGSPTSKLFMNVREKLSLCYYCSAMPESQKGIMIVASGIEVQNKQKAQDEILLQLENIKNKIITEDEFDSAKRSITNAYKEISDSPASLESWYMGRLLAGSNSSPEDSVDLIQTVTVDDIAEIARKITLDTIYFMRGTLQGGSENDDE